MMTRVFQNCRLQPQLVLQAVVVPNHNDRNRWRPARLHSGISLQITNASGTKFGSRANAGHLSGCGLWKEGQSEQSSAGEAGQRCRSPSPWRTCWYHWPRPATAGDLGDAFSLLSIASSSLIKSKRSLDFSKLRDHAVRDRSVRKSPRNACRSWP